MFPIHYKSECGQTISIHKGPSSTDKWEEVTCISCLNRYPINPNSKKQLLERSRLKRNAWNKRSKTVFETLPRTIHICEPTGNSYRRKVIQTIQDEICSVHNSEMYKPVIVTKLSNKNSRCDFQIADGYVISRNLFIIFSFNKDITISSILKQEINDMSLFKKFNCKIFRFTEHQWKHKKVDIKEQIGSFFA